MRGIHSVISKIRPFWIFSKGRCLQVPFKRHDTCTELSFSFVQQRRRKEDDGRRYYSNQHVDFIPGEFDASHKDRQIPKKIAERRDRKSLTQIAPNIGEHDGYDSTTESSCGCFSSSIRLHAAVPEVVWWPANIIEMNIPVIWSAL